MEFLVLISAKLIPFVRDSKVVIFQFLHPYVEKFAFVDKRARAFKPSRWMQLLLLAVSLAKQFSKYPT
jgi:hypothetical protein